MALPSKVYMGMSSFGKTNLLFNLTDIIRGAAVDQKIVGEALMGFCLRLASPRTDTGSENFIQHRCMDFS